MKSLYLLCTVAVLVLGGCEGVNTGYQDMTTGKHVPYYWSTWPGADKEWEKHCTKAETPPAPEKVAVADEKPIDDDE